MARIDRSKNPDPQVQQVLEVFEEYERAHPNAQIEARRHSRFSIHIRIIDPDFEGMNRVEREPEIWSLLERLPEEVFLNLTVLILLTPAEAPNSVASFAFDHPEPISEVANFWNTDARTDGASREAAEPDSNAGAILLHLPLEERAAVKRIAESEGVEDEALIRGWVLEKLQREHAIRAGVTHHP
jgi:stress-induced morphogen